MTTLTLRPRHFRRAMARNGWRIFMISVMMAAAAALAATVYRGSFAVAVTVDVVRTAPPQHTTDYTYDDYYRLRSVEAFADRVTQWMKTPRVAMDVFGTANIKPPQTLRRASRAFSPRNVGGGVVVVRYSVSEKHDAQRLASALQTVLQKRIATLSSAEAFSVIVHSPVIIPRVYAPIPVGVLTAMIVAVVLTMVTVVQAARRDR